MAIANNELWLKSTDGTELAMTQNTGWEQTLTGTRLTDDGWTVFTFDADVTVIGYWAFASKPVQAIIFPDTLKTIGASAFKSCPLTDFDLTFPDNVKEIVDGAFYETGIRSVDLNNVKIIGNNAFAHVGGLGNVEFPSTVTTIGGSSFASSSITGIKFNENSEKTLDIGSAAFRYCHNLTGDITFPDYEYGLTLGEAVFSDSYINSIVIPDSVTTLRSNLFLSCPNLTKVVIGSGVTSIELGVFANCKNLDKIEIHTVEAPTFVAKTAGSGGLGTFEQIKTGGTLYFPKSSSYYFRDWLAGEEYDLGYYGWNGVNEYAPVLGANIPSEIEEETDYQITITYPTGNELTFNTPDDVIITIDSETDNGNGTTTATGTIRVNEENTASQITISISDGANTINKTINILEKEPPMATPTISINRYADLAFPAEGGTKYITITYTNTQVSLINTPYSTAYGTTITPRTTTEIDNGVEIYYAVTVTANTYERTIPLIFSCSNAQGESTTETFTGLQAGESPNTGDAYINLDYTQHQFPASGGTFTVRATYSYPVSDTPLTVTVRNATVNTNITWCTATLVSTAVEDDWTEAYDDWMITMNPGLDFTEPMSARITFSYTDSRGGTASAEFIATREAGTTTGTQSSLLLYRTQMNFTADGEFDFNDPVCTVGYKYTNEEDIEDPVVEGDWIVVTEGEHVTRAGEILISWNVAVARNVTTASRTGTITFRAIGQDDVEHEGVCIIMQAGADDVEETFEWVDFLWKDNAVTLDGTDITFRLLDGYDEIYTGRIQQRPDADTNFFFINKIVQDYVYMEEIPALLDGTSDYQLHENGYKTFRLDSPDTVGAMRSYKFKYDWSYTDTSSFILSESIIPYVVEGQKNLITYCNLDYYGAYTDLYTWIKADGNVVNGAITAEPEEYATKVVEMPENARNYVLSGQKYEVVSPCQAKYVLYYLSPKGGWCWFPIMGKVEVSDRLTSFTLSGNYDNTTTQFGKKRYTVDIATDYNLSTGFLTESQSLRMWEMLESNMVYMHDMEKDVVFPVLMKQDTVEKKRYQRGQTKMLSYSFGVETSQGRMRI